MGLNAYQSMTAAKVSGRIAALGCPYFMRRRGRLRHNLIADDSHKDLRRGLNLGLMLIRVVRAVNDFILSGSFSDKSLRGVMRRRLPRRFFVERGDSGEGRTLSVALTIPAGYRSGVYGGVGFRSCFFTVFPLIV
jgi:hypothetical protein